MPNEAKGKGGGAYNHIKAFGPAPFLHQRKLTSKYMYIHVYKHPSILLYM